MSTLDDLVTAFFSPSRQIGPYSSPQSAAPPLVPFSAQVTIKELHTDKMTITKHPVEQGASITDHAYKQPAELMLQLAWSNSGIQAALEDVIGLASVITGDQSGDFNYMVTMYNKLLALQEARIPFNVSTGKRQYKNMLISSLSVPTEAPTEHALFVTIMLEEIIIVTTQQVTSTSADVQQNPQSNAPTTALGSVQPIPTPYGIDPSQIQSVTTTFGPIIQQ